MRRDMDKILVGRKKGQSMTNADLRKQRIYRAGLHAGAAAFIAQFRRVDMVLPIRANKRQCTKPIDDVFASPRPGKSL